MHIHVHTIKSAQNAFKCAAAVRVGRNSVMCNVCRVHPKPGTSDFQFVRNDMHALPRPDDATRNGWRPLERCVVGVVVGVVACVAVCDYSNQTHHSNSSSSNSPSPLETLAPIMHAPYHSGIIITSCLLAGALVRRQFCALAGKRNAVFRHRMRNRAHVGRTERVV